ncbi:MAG: hypothetical protein ACREQI_06500 [Candidatus Binataceae bacterium]
MNARRQTGFVSPRRIAIAAMAAVLCFATGCSYLIISGGRVDEAKVRRIEADIQTLRQLHFKHPVAITVKSRDEAEAMMETDLMRDNTPEQLAAEGAAGAMIGLYPPGIGLKAEQLKLLKSQVAGFYDMRGKKMVLVAGAEGIGFWGDTAEFLMRRDIVGQMVLAHELTHALQDQNFGLGAALDRVKDNGDRTLALKSVCEGDATIAGFAYVMGGMSAATADWVASKLQDLPAALAAQAPGTPRGIGEPLLFQYSAGVKFVAEAYRHGGWAAVDALYRHPPQSTQEIIDPARYFANPDAPAPTVKLAGYEGLMPGWKKIEDDTMGELLLRVILQNELGENSPYVGLASRWHGDQIAILTHGEDTSVIWMIAFADANSAHRFATVYASALDRVRKDKPPYRIATRGSAVLIAMGYAADYFATLAPAVWKSSAIEPVAPTLPHVAEAEAQREHPR